MCKMNDLKEKQMELVKKYNRAKTKESKKKWMAHIQEIEKQLLEEQHEG
jgi:hypothetical protein